MISKSEFADKAVMAIGYDDPETGALIIPASHEKIASWYDEWKTSGLPIWRFAHSKIKS